MNNFLPKVLITLTIAFLFSTCLKKETIVLENNQPPIVNNVPAIKIENYINRIFIDLLGREPLDSEMEAEVLALRADSLSQESRLALIVKLQTDENFIEGDTSYKRAYSQHLYDLAKVRCIEGASTAEINEKFNGMPPIEDSLRLVALLNARRDFESGAINSHGVFSRMIYNLVYDDINMNTFNFVNATFDNLFFRFPTNSEFEAGFQMIQSATPQTLFGQIGQSKGDYVNIIINSGEMSEGIIIWVYQQLLARLPSTEETAVFLNDFHQHKDIRLLQRALIVTDEYANF